MYVTNCVSLLPDSVTPLLTLHYSRTARQRIYGLIFGVGRGWVKSDAKRQRSTKIDTQRQVSVKEFIVNGSKKNLIDGEEVAAIPVHAPNAKQPARKPTPHIDRLWIGTSGFGALIALVLCFNSVKIVTLVVRTREIVRFDLAFLLK